MSVTWSKEGAASRVLTRQAARAVRHDRKRRQRECDPGEVERWTGADDHAERVAVLDVNLVDKRVFGDDRGPDGGAAAESKRARAEVKGGRGRQGGRAIDAKAMVV